MEANARLEVQSRQLVELQSEAEHENSEFDIGGTIGEHGLFCDICVFLEVNIAICICTKYVQYPLNNIQYVQYPSSMARELNEKVVSEKLMNRGERH